MTYGIGGPCPGLEHAHQQCDGFKENLEDKPT
jgi:hypothetical protein